jgi:hypothetical protein
MLCFNISPHRSGTQSFHKYCYEHGIPSEHWMGETADAVAEHSLETMDLDALWNDLGLTDYYKNGGVFSDIPVPLVYERAYKEFPAAKFLLVQRDPESWVQSVRRHTSGRRLSFLEKHFYQDLLWKKVDCLDEASDEALIFAYKLFMEEAVSFMRARPTDFGVFRLEDTRIGPKLAKFIGFEPVHEFDHIRQ